MNNSSIHHSFDIVLAAELKDVNLAILIHNFQFWIMLNQRQGINRFDDRTWTYQTIKQIASCFPYWSIKQVERLLDKAVKLKILKKGNYNKTKFDQTSWYSFVDEEKFSISRFREMEVPKSGNRSPEIGKPIPDTKEDTELRLEEARGRATPLPPLPKKKEKEVKVSFGKFVALKEGEYETLCQEMGKEVVDHYIKAIELYVPNRKEGAYKDYAAAVRTWFNRDKANGSLPIKKESEELPQAKDKKIIEFRAISERIGSILDPICQPNLSFRVGKDMVRIKWGDKNLDCSLPYCEERFLTVLHAYLVKMFPEKKKEIEKICLHGQ